MAKKTNEYWRKKCVVLAKLIARKKAQFRCEYCGMGEPHRRTHGSHIYGEGTNRGMSAMVDNILCLCSVHHVGGFWKNSTEPSWHENPIVMVEWFNKKYPKRASSLKKLFQKPLKVDFEREYKTLKKQNESMDNYII